MTALATASTAVLRFLPIHARRRGLHAFVMKSAGVLPPGDEDKAAVLPDADCAEELVCFHFAYHRRSDLCMRPYTRRKVRVDCCVCSP
jgi:hypothetical protein